MQTECIFVCYACNWLHLCPKPKAPIFMFLVQIVVFATNTNIASNSTITSTKCYLCYF